jgi:SAM domain (Sterile alpha motif)/AAA ATPase domain
MDIVVWLRSLGLEEYEAAFRDNKINERVLPNLTQEDLKEIGVGPVGHRRILLHAISALRTDAGAQGSSPTIAAARPVAATTTDAPVTEAARLTETPHTWVEWACSQLLQNTPLHPIAEWGRQRFGSTETPAEQRLADLENSLEQLKLNTGENAGLLAPLLDIPLPQERVSALPPAELRRRQLAAMTNWIVAGARSQSVVLTLEDIHWADPTTLDLLSGIAERGALVPLFVVITARPEFSTPLGHALPSQYDFARATRPPSSARHDLGGGGSPRPCKGNH